LIKERDVDKMIQIGMSMIYSDQYLARELPYEQLPIQYEEFKGQKSVRMYDVMFKVHHERRKLDPLPTMAGQTGNEVRASYL
jgi:hypothetical protein